MSIDPPEPAESKPASSGAHDLVSLLRHRYPRLALAVAMTQAARPAYRLAQNRLKEVRTYTIRVAGNDDMYDDVHSWVLARLAPENQRALVAFTGRTAIAGLDEDGDFDSSARIISSLRLRHDGNREQAITIGSHRIKVIVQENNGVITAASSTGQKNAMATLKPPEIVFTAKSAAARDAVAAELKSLVDRRSATTTRQPRFRIYGSWGGWESLDSLPPRQLESVILPAGQLERLTADIERFLSKEAEYNRRGIPWHRGHFYTGPPGTGKTSIARALASHFKLDVWYLPLSDVQKDGDLLKRIVQVTPRSILILEDVDVALAARKRDEAEEGRSVHNGASPQTGSALAAKNIGGEQGLTLAGILNSLDGMATPHGLITIMTANHPSVLDDALIRPGRIDLVEEFGLANAEQAARIAAFYYGADHRVIGDHQAAAMAGLTPAVIVEACKRHDSLEEALASFPGKPARDAVAPA
jgi:mitochondrial chaperone BCS1